MKVAIVTQPLMENYGGILQNFALQTVLKEMGHEPFTIDWLPTLELKWYLRGLGRMVLKGVPYRRLLRSRSAMFDSFIKENISRTPVVRRYRKSLLNGVDAVVVGSDQVWRESFGIRNLPDMFLRFAGDFEGKRIAYAASFGVDVWEIPDEIGIQCASLAKRLDKVSVREESGISLCREHLGIDAVQMPDPVMLLPKEAYLDLCKDIPVCRDNYVAAYILDRNARAYELLAGAEYPVKMCGCGKEANLTVPQWIALFRDATSVITDSFHGTMLARLFGKSCRTIVNEKRGKARFDQLESILDMEKERARGKAFLEEALK